MKVIQTGDRRVWKLCGMQQIQDKSYIKSRYVITEAVEDGVLVFHNVTKQLILLTNEEFEGFFARPDAIVYWFSVPTDFDEKAMVDQLRIPLLQKDSDPENISSYMYLIFTTTACNARCHYCFEKGHQIYSSMKPETAERVIEFIRKRSGKDKKAMLAWYGGEPLLNTKVIDQICNGLTACGVEYQSVIATNGYLFDKDLVQKAKDLWKLTAAQIAIDGTEQEYNKIKNYVYKEGNAYERVMENIHFLHEAGILPCIHLNLSSENGEDLLRLAEELHRQYPKGDEITVLVTPLFQRILGEGDPRDDETETRIMNHTIALTDRCIGYGFMKPKLEKQLRSSRCTPDRNQEITILPNGKVGWCDGFVDSGYIGSLDSLDFDQDEIAKFKERMEDVPECAACLSYPECIRLKRCNADNPWCTPQQRYLKEHNLRNAIRYTYSIKNK